MADQRAIPPKLDGSGVSLAMVDSDQGRITGASRASGRYTVSFTRDDSGQIIGFTKNGQAHTLTRDLGGQIVGVA